MRFNINLFGKLNEFTVFQNIRHFDYVDYLENFLNLASQGHRELGELGN